MMEEEGRCDSCIRNACERIGIDIWSEGKKKRKKNPTR